MTGHQSFCILQIVKTSAKLTSTMQVLKVVGTLKVDAQHTSNTDIMTTVKCILTIPRDQIASVHAKILFVLPLLNY